MKTKHEIRALTGLRGVAAVYVVIFHFLLGLPMSGPVTTFLAHGYLAVDLFFVLSGFVMALNYGSMFSTGFSLPVYRLFLGRRIARIYPLYFAGTLCGLILIRAGFLEQLHARTLSGTLIANLFMVQTWGYGQSLDPPAWSISTEWAAYLLFPLLLQVTLTRKASQAWLTAAFCAGALAFLCFSPYMAGSRVRSDALLDMHLSHFAVPVLRCALEFSLGLVAFRFAFSPAASLFFFRPWIVSAICLASLAMLAVRRTDFFFVLAMPVLIVSLCTGSSLPQRLLSSRLAEGLGLLSYSVYLVHELLSGLIFWLHARVASLGIPHAQTVAALFCFAITFPAAWMSYVYIEIPGRRLLRGAFEEGKTIGTENLFEQPAGAP